MARNNGTFLRYRKGEGVFRPRRSQRSFPWKNCNIALPPDDSVETLTCEMQHDLIHLSCTILSGHELSQTPKSNIIYSLKAFLVISIQHAGSMLISGLAARIIIDVAVVIV